MKMLHGSTYEEGDKWSLDIWFDPRDWGLAFWVEKQEHSPWDCSIQIGPFMTCFIYGHSIDLDFDV